MRKTLFFFVLFFGFSMPAAAQFDLVTGQVVDPNGTPYSGATVRAQLTLAGGAVTGQPTVTNSNQAQCISAGLGNAPCQMPFPGTQSFTLDPSGNIPAGGINLADNPSVTPSGTKWTFNITISPGVPPPLGTGPQSFSVAITVNSNPQNVGATLSAAAPKLANVSNGGGINGLTTGFIPKAASPTSLTNSLCDEGITAVNRITCADSAGIAGVNFTATGPSAGFTDYAQGSTSSGVPPCNTSNSICEQAPPTVTSYLVTKPANGANGVVTNNFSAGVDTQGFSGDSSHSTAVVIGSGTSIPSTTLCSAANCPAGTYKIHTYLDVTTACSTTGSYFVTVTYTDDAGSKSIVMPLIGTGTTLTLGPSPITDSLSLSSTANFAEGDLELRSTGSAAITYTTTAGACGTGGPAIGNMYLYVVPGQ